MIYRLHKANKGSTFIIVVGILSILVLIVTALSFSTRMDVISAANYADGVQSRFSALAGVTRALDILKNEPRFTAFSQDWALLSKKQVLDSMPGFRIDTGDFNRDPNLASLLSIRRDSEDVNSLAFFWITDESAKININTASENALSRSLSALLNDAGSPFAGMAPDIARHIVDYRLGRDGKPGSARQDDNASRSSVDVLNDGFDQDMDGVIDNPEERIFHPLFNGIDDNLDGVIDDPDEGAEHDGIDNDLDGSIDEADEGIDETSEFIADIRFPPFGDDRQWKLISELKNIPDFPDSLFSLMSPYLTTFSISEEVYFIEDSLYPKIDINHASVTEIYDAIRKILPDKNDNLLKQFAVNIADFRDTDYIPTVFPDSDSETPIIGVETTPYITEIYADSVTDAADGDDGQFVELYNPFPVDIDLSGWRISTGASSVNLSGKIEAKAFLIVTDDYNEVNDLTPEDEEDNYGSFYDIFDEVPNKHSKLLVEDVVFDIPDDSGTVYLYDKDGNLIDYQSYKGGVFTGINRSFKRLDPRVRHVEFKSPDPFAFDSQASSDKLRFTLSDFSHDAHYLFTSPAELMYVSSGFSDDINDEYAVWREPSVAMNTEQTRLDSRIIDLFTISPVASPRLTFDTLSLLNLDDTPEQSAKIEQALHYAESLSVCGKININTASYYTLLSLPGMTNSMAQHIVESRYRLSDIHGSANDDLSSLFAVPFKTTSDLLRRDDIWQNYPGENDRIKLYQLWSNYITTNSRSFSIVSQSAPNHPVQDHLRIHPISIFALLGLDQNKSPMVYFRYLNR